MKVLKIEHFANNIWVYI